jgi:hypothetical protein
MAESPAPGHRGNPIAASNRRHKNAYRYFSDKIVFRWPGQVDHQEKNGYRQYFSKGSDMRFELSGDHTVGLDIHR